MTHLGVIIQARMGSTRLPGKVLRDIAGKPLIDHIIGRLAELRQPATIIVATSHLPANDVIAKHCKTLGVICFRGDEHNVLARYVACATHHAFDHVVRLTADNPFTDIIELDRLIDFHFQQRNDYTHAFGHLPIGVGAEIFSFAALKQSALEGRMPNHLEHVNEYIQENPSLFRIGTLDVPAEKIAPELRLTVDTHDDFLRACQLAESSPDRWLTTEEAIAQCLRSA